MWCKYVEVFYNQTDFSFSKYWAIPKNVFEYFLKKCVPYIFTIAYI